MSKYVIVNGLEIAETQAVAREVILGTAMCAKEAIELIQGAMKLGVSKTDMQNALSSFGEIYTCTKANVRQVFVGVALCRAEYWGIKGGSREQTLAKYLIRKAGEDIIKARANS